MSDYIDIRGIRKEAVSMLKSGSSIDKTMKNTMKLRSLHSVYDSSQSLTGVDNEDSFYSSVYNPKPTNNQDIQKLKKNRSLRSINIKKFDQISLKKLQVDNVKEIKDDIFNILCFNVFKMFSKYSSDKPLDNEELVIELSNIKDAIQILSETLETVPSRNMNIKLYFHNIEKYITFFRFKEFISIIFNQLVHKSPQSNTNKNNQFNTTIKPIVHEFRKISNTNLLQSANRSFTQSEFATAFNLDPLPSILSLQGKEVQTKYLKDSLIESFRNDRVHVSSPIAKNDTSFSDDSTVGSGYISKSHANTLYTHSNLLKSKISKKVYNLINPIENENYKWKFMKIKRNERIEREEMLKIRKNMLSNYKKIAIDADRNEFHQVYQNKFVYNNNIIKKKHEDISNEQKENNIYKKREEIKYMKYILKDAIKHSRNLKEDEIMLARMNVIDNQQSSNRSVSFDSKYLSSIVDIPIDMKNKIKNAKSLIEYNQAKYDFKAYYEKTMSNRITNYKIAKDIAIHRTDEELLEYHMQKTPILGSLYFQESSIHIPVVATNSNNNSTSSIHSIYKFDDSFISTTSTIPMLNNNSSSFRSMTSTSMKDLNLSNNSYNNSSNNNNRLNTSNINNNFSNNNSSSYTLDDNKLLVRPNTREIAIEAYLEQVQAYSEDLQYDNHSVDISLTSI